MVLKRFEEFNITCNNLKDWCLIADRLNILKDMYYENDKDFYNKIIEKSIPILEEAYECKIKIEG